MYCNKCGFQLRQNLKFCTKCGTRVLKVKANNHETNKNKSRRKWRLFLLIASVLLIIIYFFENGSSIIGYSQDEAGFKKALDRQYFLIESNNENSIREIYRNFLDPKIKLVSEDEYVSNWRESNNKFSRVQVHNFKVDGNEAYVDRTILECSDIDCKDVLSKHRNFRSYDYVDGKWLMNDRSWYCPRKDPYKMPPEFSRAMSLIIQRSVPDDQKKSYQEIMNCVDVQYADSNSKIDDAEGFFQFTPGQSLEHLTIYVSQKYESKDDLLTAVLLSHELAHVINYVIGSMNYDLMDCFEDEASAFQAQSNFLLNFNDGERQSLFARAQFGPSPELVSLTHAAINIPKMKGKTYHEKALNYVKSIPYYQKQCAQN